MSPLRRYISAIRSPVMTETHKFKSIAFRDIEPTAQEMKNLRNPEQMFEPKFADRSITELQDMLARTSEREQALLAQQQLTIEAHRHELKRPR